MEYVPPIGGAPNDPYIDANPSLGVEGSAVPAASIEHVMREVVKVIEEAGLVPDAEDLTQLSQAIVALIAAGSSNPPLIASIAALVGNGYIAKTGAGTAAVRSFFGRALEIDVTNGSGVAGDTEIRLPAAITAPGSLATVGAMTAGGGLTVNGGDTNVTAGHMSATKNGQAGYASAALEARSTSGNVYIALNASSASAAAIKHTRSGNGISVEDAAGSDADIKGRDLIAGRDVLVTGQVAALNTAKAWVNFDGTGTVAIGTQHNVASITDHGTGDYTVYFTENMTGSDYLVVGWCRDPGSGGIAVCSAKAGGDKSPNGVRIATSVAGALVDSPEINVLVFGV